MQKEKRNAVVRIKAVISSSHKFRIVPESARWLVTQHKYEEADKILQRAAKINGARLPEKWWDQIDFPEKTAQNRSPQRKYNYLDLVRTPRIRLRTFACLFLWPVRFNFRILYTLIELLSSFSQVTEFEKLIRTVICLIFHRLCR